jgi:hypothetical protein
MDHARFVISDHQLQGFRGVRLLAIVASQKTITM